MLAFDAGAFQQGIAGGILNVAINFLNSATAADRSFKVVFVADPHFGEVRPEFMAKLNFKPTVIYESILTPAPFFNPLLTADAGIHVVVDGKLAPCTVDDNFVIYHGPTPAVSFEVRSRVAKPSDVLEKSTDTRTLGLSFARIDVEADGDIQTYWPDDDRFDLNNNGSEGLSRWTNGRFELPSTMLPAAAVCTIRIERWHQLGYRLANQRCQSELDRIARETINLCWRKRLARLASRLRAMGADSFMVNHFLPVRLPGLKLFAWAYDIVPVIHPEFFNQDAVDNFANVVEVFKSADALFCISRFTRDSIQRHLSIDPAKLHLSWIGASPAIYKRNSNEVEAIKSALRLGRPYILCVGTIEPRKNHAALVQAYAQVVARNPDAPDLVVAGLRGWGYADFFDQIESLNLTSHVHHFEHLTDDQIAALYSGAEMVVYPSLFEGFGLPVLEAMRCGVPIVTSRGTSMEEIAGGCGVLVNPKSPEAIANGIESLLHNPGLGVRLTKLAASKLPQFEWDTIAKSVILKMQQTLQ